MKILIVVDKTKDWPLAIPDVEVVSARAYLTESAFGAEHGVRVFNLCKSYRYQSLGYYVSLLAEARGHKPLPGANTIEDLQSQSMVRLLTQDLDEIIQHSLQPIESAKFELSIYFGHNVAKRHDKLSQHLFNLLQAPLMHALFGRRDGKWQLERIKPISAIEIPAQHHDFVVEAATRYFSGRMPPAKKRPPSRFDLAILHDPENPEPPSNAKAMRKLMKAAEALGLHPTLITRGDFGRLAEFDALFIRETTYPDHYTYRFSRRAVAEGMVVIDDPVSILRCNNKVYIAELLSRHNLATPKTLLVHRDNVDDIIAELGLPCVLKRPDSSFSLGVKKAETETELKEKVNALLDTSELIIAQEWLPTEFDWRVGVLDRRVLFVCKYYMAPGHWQIVKHREGRRGYIEGPTVAVPVSEAPPEVVKLGLKAANLIGDGLYGVDIKQLPNRCVVIEINDNPNVDAGSEDGILKDALYQEIMGLFLRRIESSKQAAGR